MILSDVRDGLKTRLQTISGLRAFDTIPDTLNPPCAVVEPAPPFDYHGSMGPGLSTFRFRIQVLVSRSSDRGGQDKLDGYCDTASATSVRNAIEGDRTLGGAVQDCLVESCSEYGIAEVGSTTYYAATFDVVVHG